LSPLVRVRVGVCRALFLGMCRSFADMWGALPLAALFPRVNVRIGVCRALFLWMYDSFLEGSFADL